MLPRDVSNRVRLKPVLKVTPQRYVETLETTLNESIRWAATETNSATLWIKLRAGISDILLNEWKNGALLGEKPEQAFFVRCDRTTMTQADVDQGRLVCLVGVAPTKPAEFVILRLVAWTVGHKS